MVASVIPCGTQAIKFCEWSVVTSTRILSRIEKSSFMLEAGGSILMNVGKYSSKTSSSYCLAHQQEQLTEVVR